MEVMAEANEQPALLNQRVDQNKKPRRPRNAAGAGKLSTAKSGIRRAKRPMKAQVPDSADISNDSGVNAPVEELQETDEQISLPLPAADESVLAADVSPGDHNRTDSSEMVEQAVAPANVSPKFLEASPGAVDTPKYEPVFGEGLIEVSGKGFGFLRDPKRNYTQSPQDIFVTPEVVRKHALRDGLWIKGEIRRGSRGPQLFKLTQINGEDPENYRNLPVFEELTSINPLERIRLETVPDRNTTRVMDLMTPIGKGQRGLIVAPPRTGKTTLLQHIGCAVVKNHPEMKLIILLVDERPEEVTEIRRTVPQADIMASSNDSDIKSHTRIAQLAIERAKRLVEAGKDVFVLMDSLTRIGRAFNNAMSGGGRTMSGGMDSRAMEIPRKLFAAARNTEEAGSLTIMATALIETGSKMDELIFQEFKGTGNMEMVLDRQISDQRIYPAIDIFKSGTRREELLLAVNDLEKINTIRRGLAGHRPPEAIERLLSFLKKFPTNAQMLREIPG
jgi:transcription termination factor Rho